MISYLRAAMERYREYVLLGLLSLFTTFLLWLPFFLQMRSFWGIKIPAGGMATIIANFDGPYYIVAAKTLYDPQKITENFSFPLPAIYYSAHYPLFPLLIRVVASLPFIGYPYAMMLVTLATSILAIWMFYILLLDLGIKKEAFWLASLFAIFPARWLIVRSIGSPEPLFLFTIIASIYFFRKRSWWPAGIFGSLAVATKPPGILLFAAFLVALIAPRWEKLAHEDVGSWLKKLEWKAYPIALIPLTLLAIYTWYGVRYGNFLAYFNSGDNIHLMFPPFQVFNPGQAWVGTFWLEEVIWIYLFGGLGLLYLIKQEKNVIASFVGILFLSILFVSHRDIARYSLPIVPFLFVAFSGILTSREFKWLILVLLIPIYLFSIAFISGNVTPIPDWGPLL